MGSIDSYNFGVYLGDIVFESSPESWNYIDSQIIQAFAKPVHFAVGNHDIVDRPLFEARYGKTFKEFDYKNSRFIFLDPNYDHWNISGYQYDFLMNALSNLDRTKNIFIFCHQVIWWRWDNKYSELKLNSHDGFKAFPNYWEEIHPVLDSLRVPVYVFSGDLGAAHWAGNFMYDRLDNVHLMSTGMGQNNGDNYIEVSVFQDSVDSQLRFLADGRRMKLDSFIINN